MLKREDLQVTESFKWRGVQAELQNGINHATGIVCVSTGNTGKAVARAGADRSIPAHIFSHNALAADKNAFIRRHGGVVHIEGTSFSSSARAAEDFAAENDMIFCSPGSSWPFVYGAGSIASEILEDVSDVRVIYAPIGGGGLISGLGVALEQRPSPRPRLVGVQSANSPYVYDLFYGRSGATEERPTIADCLAGDLERGAIILQLMHELVDAVVLLSDDEMLTGARDLASHGINVDPGAAAAFVAAKAARISQDQAGSICAVISGGGNPNMIPNRP